MISDSDGEPDVTADIEILQQGVDHAFDLADLLRIVAHLGDRIELVEQEHAAIAIGKGEKIADIPRGCPQE